MRVEFIRQFPLILALTLTAALLFAADSLALLQPAKDTVSQVTVVPQSALFALGKKINQQTNLIINLSKISAKNAQLETELAKAQAENARLENIERENAALRTQLAAESLAEFEYILAKPTAFERFLTVNKGRNDGVAAGQVIVYGNNLVGRVWQVFPETARILLVTDPGSKIEGMVAGPAGLVKGLVIGNFGVGMVLEKIGLSEPIERGQIVLTTGGGDFPAGLVLGKIEAIEKKDVEAFANAKIFSLLDFRNLDTVFIIK